MMDTVKIAPLKVRALDNYARRVLHAIATAQARHLRPPRVYTICRKLDCAAGTHGGVHNALQRLENVGLIEAIRDGHAQSFASYTMTDAGWQEAGLKKPLWME